MAHPLEVAQLGDGVPPPLTVSSVGGRISYAFQPLLEHLEADMIDKIKTKMFSRRGAFSLVGLPVALGLAAAPMVPMPSDANAQTATAAPGRRRVALALQGGGSHGAFTWGVLDRLLDDATSDIVGVTGTSAGAMNGAVLVDGLVRGGPEQARAELRRYWEGVGAMPGFGSFFSSMSGEEAVERLSKAFLLTSRP